MSDDDLRKAFEEAATPEEKAVLRQRIIQQIVTDFDAAKAVFATLDDHIIRHIFDAVARDHGAEVGSRVFPGSFESPEVIKAALHSGDWTIWRLSIGYEYIWTATESEVEMDGEGVYPVKRIERYSVPPCSNDDLVQIYSNTMRDALPFATYPLTTKFGQAYRVAIYRKRAAKSEILNRICAGVTEPFAGIDDPDIEKQIAVVELAKAVMKGLEAVPVGRVRQRVVESL